MEINKQLFEDILLGKLKGMFVLRNGETYFSDGLHRNYDKFRNTHPYAVSFGSYTSKGMFPEYGKSPFDIINFIPETDMKENELTIEIPDGKIVDWEESAKQEKIVFKKKDTKPRSWEEYYEQQIANKKHGYYIDYGNCSVTEVMWNDHVRSDNWKNVLPSEELAEAFLAMMQLMSLRQVWIGNWEPDWRKSISCIVIEDNTLLTVTEYTSAQHVLSFPTKEIAEDFLNCFKGLLEIAKPLI